MLYNLVVERTGKTGKLHNSVNFQKLIYHFMGHSKYIDFNDFIDAGTLFDDIKSKKIRFEDVEKTQTEFKSKLISALVGGNKSGEVNQVKWKILQNFTNRERRSSNLIMIILKWCINLHMIQYIEKV